MFILSNCASFSFVWLWWPWCSPTVCQQLTHRIEQLLSNKNTPYYMKSITCIQAFREQSVKVSQHLGNGSLLNNLEIFMFFCCSMEIMSQLEKITMSAFIFLVTLTKASMCLCACMLMWAFGRCISGFWLLLYFVIQLGNADLYNNYLQSLKRSIPNRGLEVFWDLLVQGMISLFTAGQQ